MPTPILTTKLYIPPLQPQCVRRPRLIKRLNVGLPKQNFHFAQSASLPEGRFSRKLTLISAPAGFGKTTLVCEWLAGCERFDPPVCAAWLSLDDEDNDLTRFLMYLIAALQTLSPELGEGVMGLLQSPQPPSTESILTALINDITTVPNNFLLVLDDYHVIDATPIDQALTFLLEHLPPQMHLVIATREDPQLPLARLRARGQMTELRANDLRFIPDEAAEFLNQMVGLNLSADDITALDTRTEGWIVGLQLAAISMQGMQDPTSFIASFTGSHRFVMDYLLEEVLHQQPKHIQTFLLHTSILDRLCGSLCDAVCSSQPSDGLAESLRMLKHPVCGEKADFSPLPLSARSSDDRASGQNTLEYLERANLFLIPLDNERRWYRYHHLFADLLRQRLHQITTSSPGNEGSVAELHRRASDWYEDNGFTFEAFQHALATDDVERAAAIVELAWSAMVNWSYQSATWLGWVKALPDDLVRARPVLCVGYAWALLDSGELEAGEARLRDAERWPDRTTDKREQAEGRPDGVVVVDEEQFRLLPVNIATARAYLSAALGDVPGTMKYARHALELLPADEPSKRAEAMALLGLAYWVAGELEAAYRALVECREGLRMAGNILISHVISIFLAEIRVAQGRLNAAVRTYEQSLQRAMEQGESVRPTTANLYVGLSILRCEQGDLEAAAQCLVRSKELSERGALPDWQNSWNLAQARLQEAQGDLNGALDLLYKVKRLSFSGGRPDVCPVVALKTRVWIRQGRLTEALGWVREQGLSVDDDLSYLREFEHVTLARVLIAEYTSNGTDRSILEAMTLLERLLNAAEDGGRMAGAIEILMLQALAHKAQGNISLALAPLERALVLAGPEGYVQVFVDEGVPMAQLLSEAVAHRTDGGFMTDYIRKLQTACDSEEQKRDDTSSESPAQPLLDPLSQRELEVLRLLAQGLSNRDICERLFLALDTVKGHNRKIFGKLDVKRRTEAVAQARELGLL